MCTIKTLSGHIKSRINIKFSFDHHIQFQTFTIMDITSLFKACVKTARLKKSRAPATTIVAPVKSIPNESRKFNSNGFSAKTRTICQQLTQLRDCLLENRSAYMKFGCHLKGVAQKMTDHERDVIDKETDKILTICTQLIIEMRKEVKGVKANAQNAEYMENVLESLTTYLKNVFGISNQMRTYRVKKELETYKLLKLKADKRDIPETPKMARQRVQTIGHGSNGEGLRRRRHRMKGGAGSADQGSNDEDEDELLANDGQLGNINKSDDENEDDDEDNYDSGTDTGDYIQSAGGEGFGEQRPLTMVDSTTRRSIPSKLALDEEIAADQSSYKLDEEEQHGNELSPEDVQMFEQENKQLLSELKGLSEEISQIEKNVTEIAKLQDLFTEKVSEN